MKNVAKVAMLAVAAAGILCVVGCEKKDASTKPATNTTAPATKTDTPPVTTPPAASPTTTPTTPAAPK